MEQAAILGETVGDAVEGFGRLRLPRIGGQRAATGEVGKGGGDEGGGVRHAPSIPTGSFPRKRESPFGTSIVNRDSRFRGNDPVEEMTLAG